MIQKSKAVAETYFQSKNCVKMILLKVQNELAILIKCYNEIKSRLVASTNFGAANKIFKFCFKNSK